MSTNADDQAEIDRRAENDRRAERFLERMRRRRRPTSPSPRQPDKSRHFNHADQIEAQLQEDGHRTWGFVIYRTTYASDDEWAEFLRRLRFQMEDTFDGYNGRDILDLFTLTLIEDRQLLDGASAEVVRDHFVEWRQTAPQEEQGRDAGLSPRYRYAIQVDAASLRSVVHDAPADLASDTTKRGWVKLIDALWMPAESDSDSEGERKHSRFSFEPIEGITEHDVGWMKIPYRNTDEYYVNFRDLRGWVVSYQRPPAVIGWPYTD